MSCLCCVGCGQGEKGSEVGGSRACTRIREAQKGGRDRRRIGRVFARPTAHPTTTTVQESGLCDACLGGSGGGGELMDKTRRGFIRGREALASEFKCGEWLAGLCVEQ